MEIRRAYIEDAQALEVLLGRAYPILMATSYEPDVLTLALPAMTKANNELLASGTFYVVEKSGEIIGCGGWTFEQPGSRKVSSGLAHLRHFATDPANTRQGVGRSIFEHCARAASEQGASRFQAFSGLNAEPFYKSMGLERVKVVHVPMGPNVKLPAVLMEGSINSGAPSQTEASRD